MKHSEKKGFYQIGSVLMIADLKVQEFVNNSILTSYVPSPRADDILKEKKWSRKLQLI